MCGRGLEALLGSIQVSTNKVFKQSLENELKKKTLVDMH